MVCNEEKCILYHEQQEETIMVTMVTAIVVLVGAAVIGTGWIMLWHFLKMKEGKEMIEAFRREVIPEIGKMTTNVLNESMDTMIDKSVEVTKKMQKALLEDDD
jgi:uncharacterized membrane protein YcjF (UPF0283 family)